ncbi:hypothetical protein [Halobacillus litoralis]|nr:hypothetical protein [Halobacillus litoralis]
MEDESFEHLEDLLLEKKKKIQEEIDSLNLRMGEIDEFLKSGKEDAE